MTTGEENKRARMAIYQLLLQHMNDEQKFHVSHKLCQEILAGVCDSQIDIDLRVDPATTALSNNSR